MNNSAVSVFPMNEEYFLMPIENWPFGSLATFPVEDGMLANIHPVAFNEKDIVPRRPFQEKNTSLSMNRRSLPKMNNAASLLTESDYLPLFVEEMILQQMPTFPTVDPDSLARILSLSYKEEDTVPQRPVQKYVAVRSRRKRAAPRRLFQVSCGRIKKRKMMPTELIRDIRIALLL